MPVIRSAPLKIGLLLIASGGFVQSEECTGDTCPSQEEIETPLCCIDPLDKKQVRHRKVGKWNASLFVIDNFFCPYHLKTLDDFLPHANKHMARNPLTHGDFPGVMNYIGTNPEWSPQKTTLSELPSGKFQRLFKRIADSEHIKCLEKGLSKFGIKFAVGGSGHDFTRFSAIDRKPQRCDVHYDDNDWVINIHLSRHFNKSGTAFWHTNKERSAILLEEISAEKRLRPKKNDTQGKADYEALKSGKPLGFCKGQFLQLQCDSIVSETIEKHEGKWEKERGKEMSGYFKQYEFVDFRMNRVAMYPGWIFHSSILEPEDQKRVFKRDQDIGSAGVKNSRFMLQTFINNHGSDPTQWKLKK